jgi:hypothetical protein
MHVILLCSTLQGESAVKSEAEFKVAMKGLRYVGGWFPLYEGLCKAYRSGKLALIYVEGGGSGAFTSPVSFLSFVHLE